MSEYYPRPCRTCGQVFRPRIPSAKFCSIHCYGSSLVIEKTPDNADEWFWSRVERGMDSQCWPWIGSKKSGYGRIGRYNGRNEYAHRISFFLKNGRFPIGVTRHTCDNRACCNPLHLIEGSIADNIQDAVERNRIAHGESSAAAKLTAANVLEIRKSSLPHSELAKIYGVQDSTIVRIRQFKTWKRLSG